MAIPILSRRQAKAIGLLRYFTGKPCIRGHIAERTTWNHVCVECRKLWRDAVREESRQKAKAYYRAHKAEARERLKRRREKSREMYAAERQRHRARKRAAPGSHTGQQILQLLEKQRGQCANCKKCIRGGYHIDHIVPLVRGGDNDIGNIQLLCPACNGEKWALDPLEWARRNGRLL